MNYNILFENENEDRICLFCGANIDVPHELIDLLFELHAKCWVKYRSKGICYPIPANY